MIESIEELLDRIKATQEEVYFRPPLPEVEIQSQVAAIRECLGVQVPQQYISLVRVTNGIETQCGYLSDLGEIRDQNIIIWEMDSRSEVSAEGDFQIRYQPLEVPRALTHLWLGYDGNSAEQIYDLASGEYRQMVLGGTNEPLNRDRSLIGLLKHMVYPDP